MNPETIRDMNWEEIQGKLEGWREWVHTALEKYGPCTTHELAGASGMGILTVRPRVTELCQLGFAECTGMAGKEGKYRAVPVAKAMENWKAAQAVKQARQLEMNF